MLILHSNSRNHLESAAKIPLTSERTRLSEGYDGLRKTLMGGPAGRDMLCSLGVTSFLSRPLLPLSILLLYPASHIPAFAARMVGEEVVIVKGSYTQPPSHESTTFRASLPKCHSRCRCRKAIPHSCS